MHRLFVKSVIAAAAAAAFALPAPADACSVTSDYVRPSNFELVQIADAVVVATAVRGLTQQDESKVDFRVDKKLKGAGPQTFRSESARLGPTSASNLDDLSTSHPEGHAGPCNRYSFRKNAAYLLFLTRDKDGSWRTAGYPFSRISEDYVEQSVWARTVRRYIRLQERLGPVEEVEALAAMLESKRGPDGETLAATELADIKDHLSSLSPWKPTPFLLAGLDRVQRGQSPEFGIRPDSANGEIGPAADLTRLLLDEPPPGPESIADRKRFILNALIEGDHPTALPRFEAMLTAPTPDPEQIGLALRFLAKHGQYPRAFQWIEANLMKTLPTLSRETGSRLVADISRVQRGDWSVDIPRWRSDPHAAATWPELALALYWYQVERVGEGRAARFDDAIAAIPIRNFRERPQLTLARAAAYDQKVVEWAVAELRRERAGARAEGPSGSAGAGSAPEDSDRLPLRALLTGWSSKHYPLLNTIFCQGAQRRSLLISSLGTHGDMNYADLLARIAAAPSLAPAERALLLTAIGDMAARAARENSGIFSSHRTLTALLERVRKGEKIEAKPIDCR